VEHAPLVGVVTLLNLPIIHGASADELPYLKNLA